MKYERITWWVVAGIAGIQALAGFLVFAVLPNWEERGQFGDMFGVVNALFSGLAFAGVIFAILLQREDLALQREELQLTREELRRTAEAQEKAERALAAQARASDQSARLAAINYLLDHYEKELVRYRTQAYTEGDPRIALMASLEKRRRHLLELLDDVFAAMTNPR